MDNIDNIKKDAIVQDSTSIKEGWGDVGRGCHCRQSSAISFFPDVIGAGTLFLFLVLVLFPGSLIAYEMDEVYKYGSNFKEVEGPGLKVYYPAEGTESISRLFATLKGVRERLGKMFPGLAKFQAKVLLTDYDDRESGSIDSTFDIISLGLFEETDALSTKGYSLEQRFAYRLASILILQSLGSSHVAIRRRISLLSIPPWFIDGLALHYAFPIESLFMSRLLEMARTNGLYNLDNLDTFFDQPTLAQEQMRFQARSMIDFWHEKAGPNAGHTFLSLISKRPAGFAATFHTAFGFSMKEGLTMYRRHMEELCREKECAGVKQPPDLVGFSGVKFFQSLRSLEDGGQVWVSSRRYSEEVYDLYHRSASGSTRLMMKNVHPALLVDPVDRGVILGRYLVDPNKQRRLSLFKMNIQPGGHLREVCLHEGPGSCMPLALKNGRVFFTSIKGGQWRLCSVPLTRPMTKNKTVREEFSFPSTVLPLDIAFDADEQMLWFTIKLPDRFVLCRKNLAQPDSPIEEVWSNFGLIRKIVPAGPYTWVTAEAGFQTQQLFRLNCNNGAWSHRQYSRVPGGIWDYQIFPDRIVAVTIRGKTFQPVVLPVTPQDVSDGVLLADVADKSPVPLAIPQLAGVPARPYKLEYRSSYWLPRIGRDAQGNVFGFYSYKGDTLDRSHWTVSPTYGFRSRDWGYVTDYMKRFGLIKAGVTVQDRVVPKSYLSKTYYERVRSTDLHFRYPWSLATTFTVGADLTKRGITKGPDRGGAVPSVGRDYSLYLAVEHRGIRTEPFTDIFPQKGRVYDFRYRKGLDWMNGNLRYDSVSMRWEEYIPLRSGFVAKLRGWFAEDKKEGGIRRPDDLSLGGLDFLHGYLGSVRDGDSLRAFSAHIGHPLAISLPFLRNWVQKELIVAEVFWERGDVRKTGRSFNYLNDAGIELRGKFLLFRRVPIVLRYGSAWPAEKGYSRRDYWSVDFSSVTGLVQ